MKQYTRPRDPATNPSWQHLAMGGLAALAFGAMMAAAYGVMAS